jgi:hypothetical protein
MRNTDFVWALLIDTKLILLLSKNIPIPRPVVVLPEGSVSYVASIVKLSVLPLAISTLDGDEVTTCLSAASALCTQTSGTRQLVNKTFLYTDPHSRFPALIANDSLNKSIE